MEPFLHVGLVLVLSGLVLKYVGNFADLLVVGCGELIALLRGATGDVEGVPVEEVVVGARARWNPSRLSMEGD